MIALPPLQLARESRALGTDRELRRQASMGLVTRIAAGVYVDSAIWMTLDSDARYRTRILAEATRSPDDSQFSHDSAAAMYGLPSIGPWSSRLHQLGVSGAGPSPRSAIQRHRVGLDPNPFSIDGVTVTSLPRTLIDVARTSPFDRAVTMIDYALRGLTAAGERTYKVERADVHTALHESGTLRGLGKAARALAFADGLSGSSAESFCRVQFMAIGLPPPVLQKEIFDERGSIGYVDFYWPELDLVVEYDGRGKYGEGRNFQRGISSERVLWEEKVREDRIRRVVRSFSRLINEAVGNRAALVQHLRPFGLHRS